MMISAPHRTLRTRTCFLSEFHLSMAIAAVALMAICYAGCRLTLVEVPGAAGLSVALLVLTALLLLLPAYWQEKGKTELRDAALTIPWALFFRLVLPCAVAIAGRARMEIGLQDGYLVRLDQLLGVSVPGIMAWFSRHWFDLWIDCTYSLLYPFLLFSFFLPALTGRVRAAQQFITSNLLAFAIGLPVFAFFPAVGPWFGYHFAPDGAQGACQSSVFLIRNPGAYNLQPFGGVCFPSFHVIWAILCVNSLWTFKYLRIPAILLSGVIILSTLTTGWHYFADVLSGILVAAMAVAGARALSNWKTNES